MMGNRNIDLIRSLSLSKSIRDSGSRESIIFLCFSDLNIDKYKQPLYALDITIKFVNNPIDLNKIKNQDYANFIHDISWDFIKILPWSLIDYNSIIFMDTDMLVLHNIDHLFSNDYDFIFTNGRFSPLNSGLFVLKPNLSTFLGLQHFIYSGYFDLKKGWFNMGRERKHYAIEVCQGMFYYYFIKSNQFRTQYLQRQIYNNLSPECYSQVDENDIKVVHFTSWEKPFPNQLINFHHNFQNKIHRQWQQNLIDLGVLT